MMVLLLWHKYNCTCLLYVLYTHTHCCTLYTLCTLYTEVLYWQQIDYTRLEVIWINLSTSQACEAHSLNSSCFLNDIKSNWIVGIFVHAAANQAAPLDYERFIKCQRTMLYDVFYSSAVLLIGFVFSRYRWNDAKKDTTLLMLLLLFSVKLPANSENILQLDFLEPHACEIKHFNGLEK